LIRFIRGYKYETKDIKNNFIKKSPKIKSVIVENVLELLYLKDFTISKLLSDPKKIVLSLIIFL